MPSSPSSDTATSARTHYASLFALSNQQSKIACEASLCCNPPSACECDAVIRMVCKFFMASSTMLSGIEGAALDIKKERLRGRTAAVRVSSFFLPVLPGCNLDA